MDQPDPQPPELRKGRGSGLRTTVIVLGTLGITGAAAWLYFRGREGALDARTFERLRPRKGTGA